jgi:hypothetical protein
MTDKEHEIASLSAETLAIQMALASVLYHLGKESPAVAGAIRRGLNDAASQIEDLAVRAGKASRPDHLVKAIRVIEELRTASLGDQDKPRHGV